jgi:hypothetical protein
MIRSLIQASLLAALLSAGLCPAWGQDAEASMSGFQFLDYLASPRQIAMGRAGTALPGPGFGSYNPASPALSDRPYLNLGYAPLPWENTMAFCEGAWPFLNMFAGLAFTNEYIGGIIPADFVNGPDYNVPGSYNGSMLSLCFGYRGEALGLALCLNGLQERIVSYTSYGLSVSAGLTYRLIPERLSLGVAIFQLGSTTGGLDETRHFGAGAPLPRSGRAGAAWSDTLFKVAYTIAADVVYRAVGNGLTSASQFFQRVSVPVGIEAWPTKYIALRLGKRFNYETDVISFGAGLRFAMLTFDMSCDVSSWVSSVDFNPYFALTYTLPQQRQVASVKKTAAKPAPVPPPEERQPLEVRPAESQPSQVQTTAAPAADSSAPVLQKSPEQALPAETHGDSLSAPEERKPDSATATIKILPVDSSAAQFSADSAATKAAPPPEKP